MLSVKKYCYLMLPHDFPILVSASLAIFAISCHVLPIVLPWSQCHSCCAVAVPTGRVVAGAGDPADLRELPERAPGTGSRNGLPERGERRSPLRSGPERRVHSAAALKPPMKPRWSCSSSSIQLDALETYCFKRRGQTKAQASYHRCPNANETSWNVMKRHGTWCKMM